MKKTSGFRTPILLPVLSLILLSTIGRADSTRVLDEDHPVLKIPVIVENSGETCAVFHLQSSDTSWADKTNRGLVFHVAVDGRYILDILAEGQGPDAVQDVSIPMNTSACLGELESGDHEITLSLDLTVSPAQRGSAVFEGCDIHTVTPDQKEYFLIKYAPILYERAADKGSDVSLLLFGEPDSHNGRTTIEYHVVFSNEDGGTGRNPAILVSRYGRATDIEWVYSVIIDESTGAILSEKYQGSGHESRNFTGRRIGTHPVLRVATDNGNFEQDGETPVRVGLMPVRFAWAKDRPRDAVMDLFPWTFRISSQEMFAEGKAQTKGAARSAMLGDMRDYLFLDYDAENFTGKKTLSFEVRIGSGKHWYSTNPGKDVPFLGNDGLLMFSGWARTNIKLPHGVRPEDVAEIRILGTEQVSYRIKRLRTFMLDAQYKPLPPFYELLKSVTLTPEKRMITIPITHEK